MIIILPYIEDTSKKLLRILRSHKIRPTFYTECTLLKLLCKPNNQVSKEGKIKTFFEIDCDKCETVYFGES